jgi:hypothetical protein
MTGNNARRAAVMTGGSKPCLVVTSQVTIAVVWLHPQIDIHLCCHLIGLELVVVPAVVTLRNPPPNPLHP